MALVGAGASDKGREKNGILFPAGHYLGGVGVARMTAAIAVSIAPAR